MLKLALILVGSVLAFGILAFAVYVSIYPLVRTIGGGVGILRMYCRKRCGAELLESPSAFVVHDRELGLTMADGGEKTGNGETNETKTQL